MVWAVSLSTTDLITRSLTPEYKYMAFGVYQNSVTREGPLVQTVLYLHDSLPRGLALKLFRREPAISKFDWNFSATHTSSPHFSTCVGSTSSGYYLTFILDMGRSPGFGSTTCYLCAYSDSLSLRLRFFRLTLQQIVTRRFILQKARYHPLTGSNYL